MVSPQLTIIPGRRSSNQIRNICATSRIISRHTCRMTSNNRKSWPMHLVLDFDGTLTVKDTMAVLGQLSKVPRTTWQEIVEAYIKDYNAHKDAPFSWQRYNRDEYSRWLASRKWVETRSAERVQDVGFFKNVTLAAMQQTVQDAFQTGELQLRPKWMELLDLVMSRAGNQVSILSVNWSETFIRTALSQAAKALNRDDRAKQIQQMSIHANEIDGLNLPEGSSGRVCRSGAGEDIRTSDDKLRCLLNDKQKVGDQFTVYVGDSSTDFDCLCAADLGVWLFDVPEPQYQKASQDTFKPLDFIPPPIRHFKDSQEQQPLFYWARNFDEIIAALT